MSLSWRKYKFEFLLFFHLILGALFGFIPMLVIPWVLYAILVYGVLYILKNGNRNGRAHFAAAYLAGFEMTIRASKAGLPHELTKYAVILLLGLGLISEVKRRSRPSIMFLYVLLLIPSIFLMDTRLPLEQLRQHISFNLSGPVCLAVGVFYFFRRPMSREEYSGIYRMVLLGIATILGFLLVKTPSVRELSFSYSANFEASAYGPNQMASLLGYGILILVATMLLKLPTFRISWVIWGFGFLILFRALLTFSRGGIFGPIIAIILGVIYYLYKTGLFRISSFRRILILAALTLAGFGVFNFVNTLSGNKLYERFIGKQGEKSLTVDKYTSGRSEIMETDLQIFNDHPLLGVGPGMGNDLRAIYGFGGRISAHIEFTRMLAEHGILGLFSLFIMLFFPLREFFFRRRFSEMQFLLIVLILSTFTFMAHSATRIALPMFMYGLGFAWLINLPKQKSALATRKQVDILVQNA